MKSIIKLAVLTAVGLALAGAAIHAQSEPPAQPPAPLPGGLPPPPAPLEGLLLGLVQKYDANQDGQLDQTEIAALKKDIADGKLQPPPPPFGPGPHRPGAPGMPPLPKEILDQYDLNHDGQLDETERDALRKDIEAGKLQLPPPGPGPRGPGDPGFGPPLLPKELLAKYDADKDGKLDETELGALLKDMRHHRPPPPGGPGPGGPPPDEAPPTEAAPR